MNVDQELISTVGQLVFAGIAMVAPTLGGSALE